jgi:DNA-binding LacI/PurR family transcriptional regulator
VVPSDDEESYLEKVVSDALKSSDRHAFVLHVSTITMQRVISASRAPAVVRGSVYPSVNGLPSVNSDHQRAATLGTQYVLHRGHRRLIVLANRWQSPRGDALWINAILRAAHVAGLGMEALDIRFLPEDAAVGAALAEEILDDLTELPAIIAYSRTVADAVQQVAESRGLRINEDLMLMTLDHPISPNNRPDYPFIERTISSTEIGAIVGRMFEQIVQGGAEAVKDELIPVRLSVPEEQR